MVVHVMHCENFGDLQKLLRVTAYILRAVERFKIKRSSQANLSNTLSPQDISASELLWVTHVQRELVQQKDYNTLKRLFCDKKGLWRCGGQLQNADIPYAARYPILLPRSHHCTGLVVQDAYIRVCHTLEKMLTILH